MITAQDVREKTFEKARINGYDMPSVDDFLEEIAESLSASQKAIAAANEENNTLRAKLKFLSEKIEEYRTNESALNAAILSAQKLAIQIENEAKTKAAAIVGDAEAKAKTRLGTLDDEVAIAQKRLADAQTASKKFFDAMRSICNAQMSNIDKIEKGVLPPELIARQAGPAQSSRPAPQSVQPARQVPPAQNPRPIRPQNNGMDLDGAVRSIEKSASRRGEIPVRLDLSDEMDGAGGENRSPFDDTRPFSF